MKYLLSLIAIGLLPCLVYGEDLGYIGHNKEGQSVGEKLNDLKGDRFRPLGSGLASCIRVHDARPDPQCPRVLYPFLGNE